jgi:flagellar biosynthesis protein
MDERKMRKAVALAYESHSAAPRITGQGEGFVAEAILAKAKEFGIPTRVEPELVEFLMQLKLNELVPPKLYAAVAEVLAWAYEIDGKTVPDPNTNINSNSKPGQV